MMGLLLTRSVPSDPLGEVKELRYERPLPAEGSAFIGGVSFFPCSAQLHACHFAPMEYSPFSFFAESAL